LTTARFEIADAGYGHFQAGSPDTPLGYLFAFVLPKTVLNPLPGIYSRAEEISLDSIVLFFVISTGPSRFAAIVFGLFPALKSSRVSMLRSSSRAGRASGVEGHRLQKVFVTLELPMALILLVGAALMLRSLSALFHQCASCGQLVRAHRESNRDRPHRGAPRNYRCRSIQEVTKGK